MIYTHITDSDDSALILKTAVSPTQRVNLRRFTESIVLFEIVKCFKMYVLKIKKEKIKEKKEDK